ncbi:MAG: hypothetical protein IKB57_00980 [Bacteroidaceae bacterium]|nr:hypothetical protein [Bacteroidaceae bacterium]
MKTYLLQAPEDRIDGGIYKGYILQVVSSRSGNEPDVTEVKEAMRRAGLSKRAESWAAPGNWIIKELKL